LLQYFYSTVLYLGVYGIQVLERVGGAGDVADLPVDLPLYARYVEEHVHSENSSKSTVSTLNNFIIFSKG
jgi:hypothetical protein